MKKYLLCISMATILFCSVFSSVSMAVEGCSVTPNTLTMNLVSMPEAGDSIEFGVDAVSDCAGDTYYYFSYCPDYGTDVYGTASARWINMADGTSTPSYTTYSRMRYTFENPGNYIVVAWTLKDTSIPDKVIPMIGTSVTVMPESGNGAITHPSDFSGFWQEEYEEDGEMKTDRLVAVQHANRVVFRTICDDDFYFILWEVSGKTMTAQLDEMDESGSYTIYLNATINSDDTVSFTALERDETTNHTLKKIATYKCPAVSFGN